MSAKWIRSQQWDREHLTGPLTPVRWVLHTFSSIPLAVALLSLVTLYGVLAAVPIGLIARIPTVLIYTLSLLACIGVVSVVPTWLAGRALARAGVQRPARFATLFFLGLLTAVAGVYAWSALLWPAMRYDPASGRGLLLLADFVEHYKSTPVRRLPGMEMSELEFYAWWPLSLILGLFVINMVVATMRRIEFTFVNIGVLTVHTGIVTIALGSTYYASAKQEGDVLLLAGSPDRNGQPTPGRRAAGFFDNTRTALWLRQGTDRSPWQQRMLGGIPRYNDYGLNVLGPGGEAVFPSTGPAMTDPDRTLSLDVPAGPPLPGQKDLIDRDIGVRVVGYATYAQLAERWRPVTDPSVARPLAVRPLEILAKAEASGGAGDAGGAGEPQLMRTYWLTPELPAGRAQTLGGMVSFETTRNMPAQRWADLSEPLPEGADHGLVVEIPGQSLRKIVPITMGQKFTLGSPVWSFEVTEISPQPPFPLITPGYQGAQSSLVKILVTPPAGAVASAAGKPFERWVYHRFPEISQDFTPNEPGAAIDPHAPPMAGGGMGNRRAADPALRLSYIDASLASSIYFDEVVPASAPGEVTPRTLRAIVRMHGQPPVIREALMFGDLIDIAPMAFARLGAGFEKAEPVSVPAIVPESERNKESIGTHLRALVAVEFSLRDAAGAARWSRTVWVPFDQYHPDVTAADPEFVVLPDGRRIDVLFGRVWRRLPDGMQLQLVDFEMIPYPHSTQPRDYRSDVRVIRLEPGVDPSTVDYNDPHSPGLRREEYSTSLNEPLKVSPFIWSSNRSLPGNALGWIGAKLGATQFKFSQSGWDSRGWNSSKAAAEAGQLPRPFASFTILGVGNNPGIYIIALGGVLVVLGIPWAFYIKPWLLRRRKSQIQAALAAGLTPDQALGRAPTPANGQHSRSAKVNA